MRNSTKKNIILAIGFLIGQTPVLFMGLVKTFRLNVGKKVLSLIDYDLIFYSNSVSFLILTYMFTYPKGINERFARFVLIVCYLDFLYILVLGEQGFGMVKLIVATITLYIYELRKWKD